MDLIPEVMPRGAGSEPETKPRVAVPQGPWDLHFGAQQGPFDVYFLLFAGIGLIELCWWPRLATLENIWHVDEHTQSDVGAGGGCAWLGLWPNGL